MLNYHIINNKNAKIYSCDGYPYEIKSKVKWLISSLELTINDVTILSQDEDNQIVDITNQFKEI